MWSWRTIWGIISSYGRFRLRRRPHRGQTARALRAGLAGVFWWGVAAAATSECIFNDASITATMMDRIHAAAGLSGTRIDVVRHTATALLGDDLFQVKWWGCDRRGLDAWLVSVHPAAPLSDQGYWMGRMRALGALVLDTHDLGRLGAGLAHARVTGAGVVVETKGSSFDRLDVLARENGDVGVVRLNASGE